LYLQTDVFNDQLVAMLYKIAHTLNIFLYAGVIFLIPGPVSAQKVTISKYGVPVLDNVAGYQQTVGHDSAKKMVELRSVAPGIVYDLRYSGSNNFMKKRMYPNNLRHTFLRVPAAQALARVHRELRMQGYGLKIFDAYRPYSVTVAFWEPIKDERYVANPAKGSGHNRGLAVDLTIIRRKGGKELNMGTGFDNFTDTAHHAFTKNLPAEVQRARTLLKETMEKHGFTAMETEWWHYYWPNDRNYEVLDIPFDKLKSGGSLKKIKQ
jgi:zinc D-Ala-D-Ala dipeptidase